MQVHIITASCENMIDGRGMRPGDILQAANGKTVEVCCHTSSAYVQHVCLARVVFTYHRKFFEQKPLCSCFNTLSSGRESTSTRIFSISLKHCAVFLA